MLNIETKEWDYGKVILISNDIDSFEMLFGGNGDLYFSPKMNRMELFDLDNPIKFSISHEDGYLYESFLNLYNKVCDYDAFNSSSSEKEFQKRMDLSRKYPLVNNGIISWHSDEDETSISSVLNISKDINNNIVLEFNKSKIDDDVYKTYSIRFRNSGSLYKPFNVRFVELYNNLCEYYIADNKVLKKSKDN